MRKLFVLPIILLIGGVYFGPLQQKPVVHINPIIQAGIKNTVAIVAKASDRPAPASRGQAETVKDIGVYEVTGYTHTGNRTTSGVWPQEGMVAVDVTRIPLHTKLYVSGYGYAVAEDTGGAIKGDKIDLFFESRAEAIQWGRRKVKIWEVK